MAKMKKCCGGGKIKPSSSNVSRRLSSGGVMKKARAGTTTSITTKAPMKKSAPGSTGVYFSEKSRQKAESKAKTAFQSSTSPKVSYDLPAYKVPGFSTKGGKVVVDTPGLAAGAKRFPVEYTSNRTGKTSYYTTNRAGAKAAVKQSQQKNKNGGKIIKKRK